MVETLTPLEWLPKDQWQAKVLDDRTIQLSIFMRPCGTVNGQECNAVYWQRWALSDFPNPLISLDDLQFLGVLTAYRRYVATVGKPIFNAAAKRASGAA